MAMKMEGVAGGKLGNTNYTMVEAKFNGRVVWPTAVVYTYVVSNVQIHYTKYPTALYIGASGDRYSDDFAYWTGDVEVKKNGVHYDTLSGVYLTPRVSGAGWFYTDIATVGETPGVTIVRAVDLANNETFDYMTETVAVCYATSSYVSGGTVRQQINAVTSTSYGTKSYGTPEIVSGSARDYMVFITSPSYTSTSNPCPASGGSVTLVTSATHTVTQRTPWTRSVTKTYTSGSTGSSTESSYDDAPLTVQDTPTITGSAEGFSRNGNNVTIASRGQVEGETRSVTYTATNNNVTSAVTLYQQANGKETVYSYTLALSILGSGNIPASGGRIGVVYTSLRTTYYEYTSGAQSTPSTAQFTSSVSVSSFATSEVDTVTGNGTFYVNVPANESYTQTRNLVVQITADQAHWASDAKTQDAKETPIALEGITILAESGDWVIGTIKTGQTPLGPVSGIIIARKSENVVDAHVTYGNIQWSYATDPGATPPVMANFNDSGTQTMTGGATLTATPYGGEQHTYYGYWLVTPTFPYGVTPKPLLSVSNIGSFTVSE